MGKWGQGLSFTAISFRLKCIAIYKALTDGLSKATTAKMIKLF